MPTVKVGDINIYYERYGKGAPVVFAHAFLDNCSVWKAQTDVLAQNHTVILYDHRGHGRSDKPKGDYSVQTLADDLVGLILVLKLGRVTLVGNSIGGMTIQKLALDHPDMVAGLVLVCTTPRMVPQLPLIGSMLGWFSSLFPYGVFARTIQKTKMYKPSREATNQAVERATQVPRYAAYACWRGLLTKYDIRGQISNIKVPALIVAGEKDFTIPMQMTQLMNKAIEGSRLEVIPECGHLPMIEKPEQFNNVLTGFLI
jgi:pimeloyl-ACP methyl ester carboxylesterase